MTVYMFIIWYTKCSSKVFTDNKSIHIT
jgi:hypothetical protein